MLSVRYNMPCFTHKRCGDKEGCPESVPRTVSEDGHFARPVCSKCEYDKGGCPDCFNFNTEGCPIPNRCKSCRFYLEGYDYGYCEYTKNAVLPDFFCAGYEQKETP